MGGLVENIPLPPVIDRYVFFFSSKYLFKYLFKNKQERADSIWWIQSFLLIFPLTRKDSDNLDKGTHIFRTAGIWTVLSDKTYWGARRYVSVSLAPQYVLSDSSQPATFCCRRVSVMSVTSLLLPSLQVLSLQPPSLQALSLLWQPRPS